MHRGKQNRTVSFLRTGVLPAFLALAAALPAQESKAPITPPAELMRSVVDNELAAARNTSTKFMFRSRKTTQKGVQNRIYIEANEAVASLTVGEGDQPLNPKQQQAEIDQLTQLANSPAKLHRRQERGQQEMEHTLRIVKALPDALLYEYAGTEKSQDGLGKEGDELVRLK